MHGGTACCSARLTQPEVVLKQNFCAFGGERFELGTELIQASQGPSGFTLANMSRRIVLRWRRQQLQRPVSVKAVAIRAGPGHRSCFLDKQRALPAPPSDYQSVTKAQQCDRCARRYTVGNPATYAAEHGRIVGQGTIPHLQRALEHGLGKHAYEGVAAV